MSQENQSGEFQIQSLRPLLQTPRSAILTAIYLFWETICLYSVDIHNLDVW